MNEKVVEIHLDEAPFLWMLRDRAACAPNYSLKDLAELDERVEAHVDGLRVAGDFGWALCREALPEGDPGVVFAAGVLALESDDAARIDAVLEGALSSGAAARGLVSAIGWLAPGTADAWLEGLLEAEDPALRRIAIAGHAVVRRDPGRVLVAACSAEDAPLRARACQAAGELGRADLLPRLVEGSGSSNGDGDAEARFCAAWSAARLASRDPRAMGALREIAASGGPEAERALDTALRALPGAEAGRWIDELRRDPSRRRLAAQGVGALGDPGLVPLLLEWMGDDALCRVAGESLTLLTGVDLAFVDLDRDAPEDYEGGPTDDPADENVAMDADDDLPWPDPDRVAAWWYGERSRFRTDERYVWGVPKTSDLREALGVANQKARRAIAFEIGLRNAGALFEVRAPARRQLAST